MTIQKDWWPIPHKPRSYLGISSNSWSFFEVPHRWPQAGSMNHGHFYHRKCMDVYGWKMVENGWKYHIYIESEGHEFGAEVATLKPNWGPKKGRDLWLLRGAYPIISPLSKWVVPPVIYGISPLIKYMDYKPLSGMQNPSINHLYPIISPSYIWNIPTL